MSRGLDHAIHAVRDLDAAADFYSRLGFTVGARNRHPWGTHNRLVQFPGFFVEILTVAESARLPAKDDISNPLASVNSEFLASGMEGLTGLVVEGRDPAGEHRAFEEAGFGGVPLFRFSRQGKRPDGSDTEVGFDLVFANYPGSPRAVFFTCKQTHPQNFWSPEMQRHPNGVTAVAACALVAENPTDHHVFLETLIGVRDLRSSSLGLSIDTPRGDVLAFNPRAFTDSYGIEAPHDAGLRVGALVFKTADLGATRALLARNAVPVLEHRGKLIVSGGTARGAVIVFEG